MALHPAVHSEAVAFQAPAPHGQKGYAAPPRALTNEEKLPTGALSFILDGSG